MSHVWLLTFSTLINFTYSAILVQMGFFRGKRTCDLRVWTSRCCLERQCTSCFFCDAGFGPIAQSHPIRFWIGEAYMYRVRFNRCVLMFVITSFPSFNAHKYSGRRKHPSVYPGRFLAIKNGCLTLRLVAYVNQKRANDCELSQKSASRS